MASSFRSPLLHTLDLLKEAVRTLVAPPGGDAGLGGEVLADVPVTLAVHADTTTHVEGVLSLRRQPDGACRIGVEIPYPLFGGLATPMRRFSLSLDAVLTVTWEPGFWKGTLTVTPLENDGLAALPTAPRGPVAFQVARGDRDAAEAFARAVARVDLPV